MASAVVAACAKHAAFLTKQVRTSLIKLGYLSDDTEDLSSARPTWEHVRHGQNLLLWHPRTPPVWLRRGFALEWTTLAWNVVGIDVLAIAARSVALAGFGLDSLLEIGASTVVIWELSGTGEDRRRRDMRLIGWAFALRACCGLGDRLVAVAGQE